MPVGNEEFVGMSYEEVINDPLVKEFLEAPWEKLSKWDRAMQESLRQFIAGGGKTVIFNPKKHYEDARKRHYKLKGYNYKSKKKPIQPKLRWEVWERDNFTCQHCGARKYLSIDHINPESKGGKTELDNLQTLCRSCNSKKKNKINGESST